MTSDRKLKSAACWAIITITPLSPSRTSLIVSTTTSKAHSVRYATWTVGEARRAVIPVWRAYLFVGLQCRSDTQQNLGVYVTEEF